MPDQQASIHAETSLFGFFANLPGLLHRLDRRTKVSIDARTDSALVYDKSAEICDTAGSAVMRSVIANFVAETGGADTVPSSLAYIDSELPPTTDFTAYLESLPAFAARHAIDLPAEATNVLQEVTQGNGRDPVQVSAMVASTLRDYWIGTRIACHAAEFALAEGRNDDALRHLDPPLKSQPVCHLAWLLSARAFRETAPWTAAAHYVEAARRQPEPIFWGDINPTRDISYYRGWWIRRTEDGFVAGPFCLGTPHDIRRVASGGWHRLLGLTVLRIHLRLERQVRIGLPSSATGPEHRPNWKQKAPAKLILAIHTYRMARRGAGWIVRKTAIANRIKAFLLSKPERMQFIVRAETREMLRCKIDAIYRLMPEDGKAGQSRRPWQDEPDLG